MHITRVSLSPRTPLTASTGPRNNYWGDTALRSSPEVVVVEKPVPRAPQALLSTGPWRLPFRMALPVYAVVVAAPVVGCSVAAGLTYFGCMTVPLVLIMGAALLTVTVVGTALAKFFEERESAPPSFRPYGTGKET